MGSSGLTLCWTIFVKTMTRLQLNCNSDIFDWILVPLLLVFDGVGSFGEKNGLDWHVDSNTAESKVRKMPSSYLKE